VILDKIAEAARKRVAAAKDVVSLPEMKRRALKMPKGDFRFEWALRGKDISFICEVKRASPSKGVIAEGFPYLDIAREYEEAGAACVSVLTEPEFFRGCDRYLSEIRERVKVPVLRKDFTVDEYQLYEAKVLGADAVLLICALLDGDTLNRYLQICDGLGLCALVEAHTGEEISSALKAGARIVGINNRDLKTFKVDLHVSVRLRHLVPENILFVAESGIKTPEDVAVLRKAGVDAVLIGETLMRSPDKKAALLALRGGHTG